MDLVFYGVIVAACVLAILGLLWWSLSPETVDDRDETDEAGA